PASEQKISPLPIWLRLPANPWQMHDVPGVPGASWQTEIISTMSTALANVDAKNKIIADKTISVMKIITSFFIVDLLFLPASLGGYGPQSLHQEADDQADVRQQRYQQDDRHHRYSQPKFPVHGFSPTSS